MNLLYSFLPAFSNESLFFTAVSAMGLFFLLIGWVVSTFSGDLDLFGDSVDNIELDNLSTESSISTTDEIDFSNPSGDLPMPSFFSLKVFRIIMLSFGAGGNTGLQIGFTFENSLILASITGFLSGFIVYKAFGYIYKQTVYNYRDPIIVGREGRVILGIPTDGYGQITILIVGQRYIFRAKSLSNIPISEGTSVKIIHKLKGTCTVMPV